MTNTRQLVAATIAVVSLAMLLGWLALARGWFEIPLSELEQKYTTQASRWMDVDGIRVHYFDELPTGGGSAPVVVLSHASFMSLRSWDSLAASLLRSGYRVIRMDYLNAGLTGFDSRGRSSRTRQSPRAHQFRGHAAHGTKQPKSRSGQPARAVDQSSIPLQRPMASGTRGQYPLAASAA